MYTFHNKVIFIIIVCVIHTNKLTSISHVTNVTQVSYSRYTFNYLFP